MRANDRCLITLILGITVLADPLAFAGEANPNVSSSAR